MDYENMMLQQQDHHPDTKVVSRERYNPYTRTCPTIESAQTEIHIKRYLEAPSSRHTTVLFNVLKQWIDEYLAVDKAKLGKPNICPICLSSYKTRGKCTETAHCNQFVMVHNAMRLPIQRKTRLSCKVLNSPIFYTQFCVVSEKNAGHALIMPPVGDWIMNGSAKGMIQQIENIFDTWTKSQSTRTVCTKFSAFYEPNPTQRTDKTGQESISDLPTLQGANSTNFSGGSKNFARRNIFGKTVGDVVRAVGVCDGNLKAHEVGLPQSTQYLFRGQSKIGLVVPLPQQNNRFVTVNMRYPSSRMESATCHSAIRLNHNATVSIPPSVVENQNGDFDGDHYTSWLMPNGCDYNASYEMTALMSPPHSFWAISGPRVSFDTDVKIGLGTVENLERTIAFAKSLRLEPTEFYNNFGVYGNLNGNPGSYYGLPRETGPRNKQRHIDPQYMIQTYVADVPKTAPASNPVWVIIWNTLCTLYVSGETSETCYSHFCFWCQVGKGLSMRYGAATLAELMGQQHNALHGMIETKATGYSFGHLNQLNKAIGVIPLGEGKSVNLSSNYISGISLAEYPLAAASARHLLIGKSGATASSAGQVWYLLAFVLPPAVVHPNGIAVLRPNSADVLAPFSFLVNAQRNPRNVTKLQFEIIAHKIAIIIAYAMLEEWEADEVILHTIGTPCDPVLKLEGTILRRTVTEGFLDQFYE
jgi:hypothetical protein